MVWNSRDPQWATSQHWNIWRLQSRAWSRHHFSSWWNWTMRWSHRGLRHPAAIWTQQDETTTTSKTTDMSEYLAKFWKPQLNLPQWLQCVTAHSTDSRTCSVVTVQVLHPRQRPWRETQEKQGLISGMSLFVAMGCAFVGIGSEDLGTLFRCLQSDYLIQEKRLFNVSYHFIPMYPTVWEWDAIWTPHDCIFLHFFRLSYDSRRRIPVCDFQNSWLHTHTALQTVMN